MPPLAKTPGSDPISTKLKLAGLRDGAHDIVQARAGSTPCPQNPRSYFVPQGSPAITYTDKPQGEMNLAESQGWGASERLVTPAAAAAKVAGLRKTMAKCTGKSTSKLGSYRSSGTVKPPVDLKAGDGGLAITQDLLIEGNSKPETVHDAIFSTGPYVVHIYGAIAAVASQLAPKVVKVLGDTP